MDRGKGRRGAGDPMRGIEATMDITRSLRTLVEFYPRHIEKEDKIFFPASRAYFTLEEDQAMLAEFWELDRKMIHEKYKSVVEGLKQVLIG
jgi:hemerythrin-like domain-containing protein